MALIKGPGKRLGVDPTSLADWGERQAQTSKRSFVIIEAIIKCS